jgi:hypothetical protein
MFGRASCDVISGRSSLPSFRLATRPNNPPPSGTGLRRHRRASLNRVCHAGAMDSVPRRAVRAASTDRVWVSLDAKRPQNAGSKEAEMATTELTVKITPNDKGNPAGKLADAELHFAGGPLNGLKLIGFSVWERRGGSGRHVTFPARQYTVNFEAQELRVAEAYRRHGRSITRA